MSPHNLKFATPSSGGVPPKKRERPGRAVEEKKISALINAKEYLENNDDETVTLDKLHKIMEKEVGSKEVYC